MSLLLHAQRRARQQRALQTLDDILTEEGGIRLSPLRWMIEPNSSLTGSVPPMASEEEIRDTFFAWVRLLRTRPLTEVGHVDRTILRAVLPKFGLFHVYVTITATIPDVLVEQERELANVV